MIPQHSPSPAETDLVRFWHAVHAYLAAQTLSGSDSAAAYALTDRFRELVDLHNEIHSRWIDEPIADLAGT